MAKVKSGKYVKFLIYLVAVVLVNLAGITPFQRFDLTANGAYSLLASIPMALGAFGLGVNGLLGLLYFRYFAITFDHRLVDGADADQFMNHMQQTLLEEAWSELDAFA